MKISLLDRLSNLIKVAPFSVGGGGGGEAVLAHLAAAAALKFKRSFRFFFRYSTGNEVFLTLALSFSTLSLNEVGLLPLLLPTTLLYTAAPSPAASEAARRDTQVVQERLQPRRRTRSLKNLKKQRSPLMRFPFNYAKKVRFSQFEFHLAVNVLLS